MSTQTLRGVSTERVLHLGLHYDPLRVSEAELIIAVYVTCVAERGDAAGAAQVGENDGVSV